MKSSVARGLADAYDHHVHGRLAEAEAGYRDVLAHAPDQPDALHRLGILAHQVGRHETGLQLIERAIAVDPRHPAYYNDAGIVPHALGRIDDAIARYRDALAVDPNYAKAHNGAGIALKDKGLLDDAADSFRKALSLEPDYVAAQNNLANLLRARGDGAEAARLYRRAIERGGQSHELLCNLADTLRDLRRFDDAANAYARALVLRETAVAIAGFVETLVRAALHNADRDVRRRATRALATPWARPADLAPSCIRLLASGARAGGCIANASAAWPRRLSARPLFAAADGDVVFGDPLLCALLASAPVCDLAMERFLTSTRYAILDLPTGDGDAEYAPPLEFCCALARQCFVNDYVFAHTDDEIARAGVLRDRLVAALAAGNTVSARDIAVVAAYFPLSSLAQDASLLAGAWPAPLAALLTQQLREPAEERRLRDRVRRLTALDGAVSADVRQQYEEHPYPKWVALPPPALEANPRARFPRALWRVDETRPLDILVAGCGTGQESIEVAQAFPRAHVLAVDLSLASLGYAARKANERGLENIEHAQADITRAASLGRTFDVISSVGVLHHLAEPVGGLRELASLLAPDGHMLVGVYSERARSDVVAARAFIAERGYAATADDIRRCRQDLMAANDTRFSALASRSDFYVTAECRDLLFHVQEHRFTLPQISEMLDALGLRFNGFLLAPDVATRYAERYPSDPGMENLANWDRLEAELPGMFAGMYIFWLQKR